MRPRSGEIQIPWIPLLLGIAAAVSWVYLLVTRCHA